MIRVRFIYAFPFRPYAFCAGSNGIDRAVWYNGANWITAGAVSNLPPAVFAALARRPLFLHSTMVGYPSEKEAMADVRQALIRAKWRPT